MHYTNGSVSFPLVKASHFSLPKNTNQHVISSVVFHQRGNYSIHITNTGSSSLIIDSIVIVPYYEDSVLMLNASLKNNLVACWNESLKSLTLDVPEKCQFEVFTSTAKWFDGAKGKSTFCL